MLENLISSRLKKKLLAIFFNFPKRSFSVFELRVMTGASIAQISQALKDFVRGDLVSVGSRKQRRFFRINPHFRLYDELRDLAAPSDGGAPEDEVSRKIRQIPNLKLAVLSGVFTLQPHLPVDLLLVGEDVNRLRLARALADIERLCGQEINYAVMDPQEYNYRRMLSDRFIRDVFDNPNLVVFNTFKK